MNDPLYSKLQETSWRRKLSAEEEAKLRAWLAAHPEAGADWEAESALNVGLSRLPDAPVPTNFTARVVAAVERENDAASRRHAKTWSWRWLVPRAAVAALVLGLGVFSYEEYRETQRARIAEDVAAISRVASAPSPELMRDFKAIGYLNQAPGPDEELLALFTASK